ncbi:uncharacterized protein GlcG (DUF336 family) [Paraburkholderia sp. BL6665CI2N2]|uniref:heme-binding protein n=1 Tax=Paraburkholderia sp. BL6665CI2N2 TaxID=1938806 RepID=UPI001066FC85|nr:heme-binding protein [Paraburkholderia sp. BL6665CI2N2]TDY15507.1 uncharacterized protein GlcG (DUF336 family) [Paraburkholderia sp. BL6665CI2N2]
MKPLAPAQANRITTEAVRAACEKQSRPIASVVVDHLALKMGTQREDGAATLPIKIGAGKGSVVVRTDVRVSHVKANFAFFRVIPVARSRSTAQTGSVVIKTADGYVDGAMADVGGTSDKDGIVRIEGVPAAALPHS